MHENPYYEILRELTDRRIEIILGGGLACVLHGVERVTMDIDVAGMLGAANFLRLSGLMNQLGLAPRGAPPAETPL